MSEYDIFIGIDWATAAHQLCVMDPTRKVVDERQVVHRADDLIAMAAWLAGLAPGRPERVAVAIEVPRGAVVEVLLERGLHVYAINPKQLDRFRDRHTVAGAKDDRRDAFVLADSLRTDLPCFRRLAADDAKIVRLRELSRTQDDLDEDARRQTNRLREQALRVWPELLRLCEGADQPWFWSAIDLMVAAVSKPGGRGVRPAAVRALLANHRIKRVTADQVVAAMRATPLLLAPGAADAAVSHIELLLPQVRLLHEQRRRCDRQINELLDALGEGDQEGQKREHRDVPVLRSLPGVGNKVAATMLAEAPQALAKRDYQTLRALAGCAPITRSSGKNHGRPPVVMRRACNDRLREACFHMARTAVQYDEATKLYYAQLRQRGHAHARALRSVADRHLRTLIAMLTHQTEYDPERARSRQKAA